MKDLKCGLKDCVHNSGYCCRAKSIEVDRYTDCLTYEQDQNKRKNLTEAGKDVKARYDVDTAVTCHAHCVFNRASKCIANGITVMNSGDKDAQCLTFVKD